MSIKRISKIFAVMMILGCSFFLLPNFIEKTKAQTGVGINFNITPTQITTSTTSLNYTVSVTFDPANFPCSDGTPFMWDINYTAPWGSTSLAYGIIEPSNGSPASFSDSAGFTPISTGSSYTFTARAGCGFVVGSLVIYNPQLTASTPITVTVGSEAPPPILPQTSPQIPATQMTFGQLIDYIYRYSLYILGASVFVMFMYAGFRWLTAAGNPGVISSAKGIMFNALIGAILLLSAYIILYTINPDLVGGNVTIQNFNQLDQRLP